MNAAGYTVYVAAATVRPEPKARNSTRVPGAGGRSRTQPVPGEEDRRRAGVRQRRREVRDLRGRYPDGPRQPRQEAGRDLRGDDEVDLLARQPLLLERLVDRPGRVREPGLLEPRVAADQQPPARHGEADDRREQLRVLLVRPEGERPEARARAAATGRGASPRRCARPPTRVGAPVAVGLAGDHQPRLDLARSAAARTTTCAALSMPQPPLSRSKESVGRPWNSTLTPRRCWM